jgi:holo-[acyl-carrier protein] synthase
VTPGVRGIGVDAVDIARFRRLLARRPAIVGRIFTESERAYAQAARDPATRLAGRFAAKEAVWKALGVGIGAVGFHEVEVRREVGGRPALALSGRAASLAASRGVSRWHLSLSHTDAVAIAAAVAEAGAGLGRPEAPS